MAWAFRHGVAFLFTITGGCFFTIAGVIHLQSFTVYRDIDIHTCACTTSQRTTHITENVVTSCATFHTFHACHSMASEVHLPTHNAPYTMSVTAELHAPTPQPYHRLHTPELHISQTSHTSGASNSTCQCRSHPHHGKAGDSWREARGRGEAGKEAEAL